VSHLTRYLKQACSLQAVASLDSGGAVTYAAATTGVSCRAWREEKRRELPDGEVYTSQVVLLVPAAMTIAAGYRVTSITGTGMSGTYRVREVFPVPGEDPRTAGQVDHLRCYLD